VYNYIRFNEYSMEDIAVILKALAEETRLRLLRLLAGHELSVGELVEALRVPQSRISRHLAVLRRAGLVRDRREGNWVYYRAVADEAAGDLWRAVEPHLAGERFHPGDLGRLDKLLAKRRERSKAYFDSVVSEWDRIKRDYIQDALPFLVIANLLRPDAVAVDVGTGTGEVLPALAARAAKVIGVDSSEKMLDACRARLEEAKLANVELRRGDAEALPLADAECDLALCSMVLHHLADPARGVAELARVVRPGGKVVLVDLVEHDRDWTREVMADLWLGFAPEKVSLWLQRAGLTDATYITSAIDSPLKDGPRRKLRTFIAAATKPPSK